MRERLKNLLLAALLLLMVVLLGVTMLLSMRNSQGGKRLMQAFQPAQEVSSGKLNITVMAWPEKLAVLSEAGVYYAADGEGYALLYQQGEAVCLEALGSADVPQTLTEREYQAMLKAPAIIAEYHNALPLYLLQAWGGGEELREGQMVRRFALVKTQEGVGLLLTDEEGNRWYAKTAASAAELEELCAQPWQNNAELAENQFSGLMWDELLLSGATTLQGYEEQQPDIVEKGELSQQVQKLFSMNPYLARVYQNSSGSLVYVEGRSTLSLSPDGELIYAGAEGADLELSEEQEPQRTAEICQKVCTLIREVWGETGAFGRLNLDSVRQENGQTVLTFALDMDGRFLEREESWAQVTVEDGVLIGASVSLRQMETQESTVLLPMRQAAGILQESKGKKVRLCIRMVQQQTQFVPGICRVAED